MIVEWQRVRVRPELRQRFLEADEAVWTAGLRGEKGFLGKEVWLERERPGEVVLVIRWRSERDWRGIPGERLDELERRFGERLPEGHEVVEMRVFEVVGGAEAGYPGGSAELEDGAGAGGDDRGA